MELPPLVLGTILNREQSQEVLKKGLLPFGTCVKHVSAGFNGNKMGCIVKHPDRIGYVSCVHTDVLKLSGCNWSSVKQMEIYPPLSSEAWRVLKEKRDTYYGRVTY